MTGPYALILAGSGMLTEVTERLARDGWCALHPSRRYSPVPNAPDSESHGRALWVEASWEEPHELAREVAATTHGAPVELLVTWLHESYRRPVLDAVTPLLAPAAPMVDVRSAGDLGRPPGAPEAVPRDHPTQQVVLGDTSAIAPGRPLAHRETVAGVLAATGRAIAGAPSSLYQVGERRPRARVPRPRVHWGAAAEPVVPNPRLHSA